MPPLSDAALRQLQRALDVPDAGARYEVLGEIGRGGMGSVYRAMDASLGREVALKVLAFAGDAAGVAQRLTREARVLAQLEHPAIVPIHDVGVLADGRPYYVMRLVRGSTLAQHLVGRGRGELLRLFLQICNAAAFAHARGVIHRDLTPGNIMIGEFGEVLLVDWGVARVLAAGDGRPAGGARALGDDDTSGRVPDERGSEAPRSQKLGTREDTEDTERTLGARAADRLESRDDMTAEIAETSDGAIRATRRGREGGDRRSPDAMRGDVTPERTAEGMIVGTPGFMSPEQARGAARDADQRADVYGLGAILRVLLAEGATHVPSPLAAIVTRATAPAPDDRYPSALALATDVRRWLDDERVEAYRESALERFGRFFSRNRPLILLLLGYALVRIVILLWRGV